MSSVVGEGIGGATSKPPIFGGLDTAAPCIFEQKITKGAKLPEFQNIHSNSSFCLLPSVHRFLSSALVA
jgi:hypothetical protein